MIIYILIIILILIIYKLYKVYKEPFEDKCLFVLYGESFRDGLNQERTRDTEKSVLNQMIACDSHLKFINTIQNKYKINTDVVISTYDTKYENELKEKYKNQKLIYKSQSDLIGANRIAHKAIEGINLNEYTFVLFTRNDVFLIDQFVNDFILYDKIMYLSQNLTIYDCYTNKNASLTAPSVIAEIVYVPKKYFNIINDIKTEHTGWFYLKQKYNYDTDEIGFMLNSHHDANTYTGWNPYYKFIGRDESQTWIDKDKANIYLQNKECYTKVELD
jgi:hypothetical protein